jgi:hypothetical protein
MNKNNKGDNGLLWFAIGFGLSRMHRIKKAKRLRERGRTDLEARWNSGQPKEEEGQG